MPGRSGKGEFRYPSRRFANVQIRLSGLLLMAGTTPLVTTVKAAMLTGRSGANFTFIESPDGVEMHVNCQTGQGVFSMNWHGWAIPKEHIG
jgi:hypothetical protein